MSMWKLVFSFEGLCPKEFLMKPQWGKKKKNLLQINQKVYNVTRIIVKKTNISYNQYPQSKKRLSNF